MNGRGMSSEPRRLREFNATAEEVFPGASPALASSRSGLKGFVACWRFGGRIMSVWSGSARTAGSAGMRRAAGLVSLTTILAGAPAMGASAPSDQAVLRETSGEVGDTARIRTVLVHTADAASLKSAQRAARAAGAEVGTSYPQIRVFVAYGTARTLEKLGARPEVQRVEDNRRVSLLTETSHMATRGQQVLDGVVRLDGQTIDGRGVGVAVIDTGIDGTHQDLSSQMGGNVRAVCAAPGALVAGGPFGPFTTCKGPKIWLEAEDTDTLGVAGHGTHVAGIVAGTGARSQRRRHGAAPGATLFGVGIGTVDNVENALDGLQWVLENHDAVTPAIRVVNASWGSGYEDASDGTVTGAINKLVDALIADGVTVVFAAGNDGGTGSDPRTSAQCVNPTPGLLCVASYDDRDTGTRAGAVSGFSSRGARSLADSWPDVSAPGSTIASTCQLTLPSCRGTTDGYAVMSGTSMAAPHVAGIIAQMYQVHPRLSPAEVEYLLEDTAEPYGSYRGYEPDPRNPSGTYSSFDRGHGLVDALAAVETLLQREASP